MSGGGDIILPIGGLFRRQTTKDLSDGKKRLEDERQTLKREQRLNVKKRGKEDTAIARRIEDVDLQLDIAHIQLKLEDLSTKRTDTEGEARQLEQTRMVFGLDEEIASRKLELFRLSHGDDPEKENKMNVIQQEIDDLDGKYPDA